RVMDKAEEHTQRAARLAVNLAQAELARRQGASIRAMKHAGIERGGYKRPWTIVTAVVRRLSRRESSEAMVAADVTKTIQPVLQLALLLAILLPAGKFAASFCAR